MSLCSLQSGKANNDEDAVALGNMLLECNLIIGVSTPSAIFSNNDSYFRFNEDAGHMGLVAPSPEGSGGSSFWQHYATNVFGKADDAVDNLQPELPWEEKKLHEGVEDIATVIPPIDASNVKLLGNVHPVPWENPPVKPMYNLVVIGGGAAGLVSAIGSASVGAKVALIEGHLLGGDCTNFGCVPSKALIKSATVIHSARNGATFGLDVEGGDEAIKVNFARVMERLREVRAEISEFEAAKRLKSLGIDVFVGRGVFDSTSSIVVNEERLKFRKCIICSGGKAYVPNLQGLNQVPYLTNESLFNLTELPKSMLVVGGGPIGIEMAQSFQRFGTEVTVLIRGKKILDKEDLESALVVEATLRKDGIKIVTCAQNQRFEQLPDGRTAVHYDEKCKDSNHKSEGKEEKEEDTAHTLIVEKVLIATGRRANVNGFGLETAGVRFTEQQGIEVDDNMRTSNPIIYAAGDCCSHYQFTHAADHMARICIVNALFFGGSKFSSLLIPWATFTEPEIAHVGLYPRDMDARRIPFDTYTKHFSDVDRAVCEGSTEGFVKIHVKKGTDKIIGATIVGEGAGDMISEICTLMHAKIGLAKLASIIHPYPTRADAIRQIGDEYNQKAMTPFMKKMLKAILAFGLR